MEHNDIDSCIEEWETLSNEYRALEVRKYEGYSFLAVNTKVPTGVKCWDYHAEMLTNHLGYSSRLCECCEVVQDTKMRK